MSSNGMGMNPGSVGERYNFEMVSVNHPVLNGMNLMQLERGRASGLQTELMGLVEPSTVYRLRHFSCPSCCAQSEHENPLANPEGLPTCENISTRSMRPLGYTIMFG